MSNTDKIEQALNLISSDKDWLMLTKLNIRALLDENRELWRMLDVVHGEASKEEYLYDMNPKLKDELSALLKRKPKDL